jgi:glucosyl-3-phosphoglycerate phosphatase
MDDWKQQLAAAAQAAGLAPQVDRFYFLRHGETDHNRQNIVQGWTDIPLNGLGEAQARQSAEMLRTAPITRIIASPLQRAHRTAQIVAEVTGHQLHGTHEGLRERCFGGFENKPSGKVAWMLHDDKSEDYETFSRRIARGLNECLTEGVPLIVAHGGTRRVLLYALGLDVSGEAMGNAVPMELSRTSTGWQVKVLLVPTITEAGIEA